MTFEERAYCAHLLVPSERKSGYSNQPDVSRLQTTDFWMSFLKPIFDLEPSVNDTLRQAQRIFPDSSPHLLAYYYVQEQVYKPLWEDMMKCVIAENYDSAAAYYDFMYGVSAPLDVLIDALRLKDPSKISPPDNSWMQKYAANPDFNTTLQLCEDASQPPVSYDDLSRLIIQDPSGKRLIDTAMDRLILSEGCDLNLVRLGSELGFSVYSRIFPLASEVQNVNN